MVPGVITSLDPLRSNRNSGVPVVTSLTTFLIGRFVRVPFLYVNIVSGAMSISGVIFELTFISTENVSVSPTDKKLKINLSC